MAGGCDITRATVNYLRKVVNKLNINITAVSVLQMHISVLDIIIMKNEGATSCNTCFCVLLVENTPFSETPVLIKKGPLKKFKYSMQVQKRILSWYIKFSSCG